MDDGSWRRLRETVENALDAESAAGESVAALKDDAVLREHARSLLALREDTRGFLEPPVRGVAGWLLSRAAAESGVGRRFGPYRSTSILAVGGMGAVYTAVRDDDAFERIVAVKLLRPGLFTSEAVARFERERRLLARLAHPNVAALLDGGRADDGSPFLVLEYVPGEAIDRYCRERHLSLESRVRLFLAVCEAVQHAHRNLIVHRDLKPDNIFVTPEGVPKLLDFGISKLIDPLDEAAGVASATTMLRAFTPRYASPEQRRGEPTSTASDVYSLGVILHALLTDETAPSDREAPAALLTDGRSALWVNELKGHGRLDHDLAAIVRRATAEAPSERYPSADALRADLARYLNREPISARAATLGYVVHRWVRRHRTTAALLAAVGLLVVAFVAFAGVALARLEIERRRTSDAYAVAQRINLFLSQTLEAADAAAAAGGGRLELKTLLDEATRRIERELAGAPAVAGPLRLTLANAYLNLGRYRDAQPHFIAALADIRAGYGEDHLLNADAEEGLARYLVGTGDYTRAEKAARRALDLRARAEAQDADARLHLLLANAIASAGNDRARARAEYEAALNHARTGAAPDPRLVVSILGGQAKLAEEQSDFDSALTLRREALEVVSAVFGPASGEAAFALHELGRTLQASGDPIEAQRVFERSLEVAREAHGSGHPTVTRQLLALALLAESRQALDEADRLYGEALRIADASLPRDHYIPIFLRARHGDLLTRLGRFPEAEAALLAAYEGCVALLGEMHFNTRHMAELLADLYAAQSRPEDAAHWRAKSTG